MCNKCGLTSIIADDKYECTECGYTGRTDPKKPGHCPKCGHDMGTPADTTVDSMSYG